MPKKDDIKLFDSICRKHKMTDEEGWEFSDYVHALKARGTRGSGSRGDFSYHELDSLAREFLGLAEDDEE